VLEAYTDTQEREEEKLTVGFYLAILCWGYIIFLYFLAFLLFCVREE